MVFFIELGNLSEILRNAVIDFLLRICYDETKRQVHGMREILLLEDDGALGRGIGLYLVRQIAEGQGGYVKVSSRPGEGSTFSLYLPRETCQHC